MPSSAAEQFRANRSNQQRTSADKPVEVRVAPGIVRTKNGYVVEEEDFLIMASLAPATVVATLDRLRLDGKVAKLMIEGDRYTGRVFLSGDAFEELMGKRNDGGFGVSEGELGDYNGTPTRRGEAYDAAQQAQKPLMAFQAAREEANKLVKPSIYDEPKKRQDDLIRALLSDSTGRTKLNEMWEAHARQRRRDCQSLTELREEYQRGHVSLGEYTQRKLRCVPSMQELRDCWDAWAEYERNVAQEMSRRNLSGPIMTADGYAALMRSLGIEV